MRRARFALAGRLRFLFCSNRIFRTWGGGHAYYYLSYLHPKGMFTIEKFGKSGTCARTFFSVQSYHPHIVIGLFQVVH